MCQRETTYCPECPDLMLLPNAMDRRQFIKAVGGATAALAAMGGLAWPARRALAAGEAASATAATAAKAATAKPAESLIRELYATLTAEQKKTLVRPWNQGAGNGGQLTRMGMYNRAIDNQRIGDNYTEGQQELLQRILRAISSDEDGYRRITREGTFDTSGSFKGCGAHIFGEPVDGKPYAWMFTGHHLTVRCDGNSEPGAGFGGPMYYGHSVHGYSPRNVFNYQTKSVLGVFDALSEKQRQQAVITGSPGEQRKSIQFRKPGNALPGLAYADMSSDQQKLVSQTMRNVLSPFRKEDGDEVMDIINANGGMSKVHLAFYRDQDADQFEKWHFWRLEGPGFVWNFRVLPHVHCYVNVAKQA